MVTRVAGTPATRRARRRRSARVRGPSSSPQREPVPAAARSVEAAVAAGRIDNRLPRLRPRMLEETGWANIGAGEHIAGATGSVASPATGPVARGSRRTRWCTLASLEGYRPHPDRRRGHRCGSSLGREARPGRDADAITGRHPVIASARRTTGRHRGAAGELDHAPGRVNEDVMVVSKRVPRVQRDPEVPEGIGCNATAQHRRAAHLLKA